LLSLQNRLENVPLKFRLVNQCEFGQIVSRGQADAQDLSAVFHAPCRA
jgi:hypothetical protein